MPSSKTTRRAEEVLIPPRAHLPPWAPNLVTSRGLALLEAELITEHERLEKGPSGSEQATQVAFTPPIAAARMGHQVGDGVPLQTARERQTSKLLAVEYTTL